MSYVERLQRTIDFMEMNLKEEVSLAALAEIACFSPYHYARLFQLYAGTPVMEYFRSRRLSAALREIKYSNRPLIDIGMDYGFGSRDSFTRAFRRIYGMTPSRCRKQNIYPLPGAKMDLGELEQNARRMIMIFGLDMKIMEIPALTIAGYELRTNSQVNFQEIPKFWQKIMKDGLNISTPEKLCIPAEYSDVCLGFCTNFNPENQEFSYIVGWIVEPGSEVPEDLTVVNAPALEYAIFTTPPTIQKYFPSVIQLVTRYAFRDWLPESDYEYDDKGSDFEWYDKRSYSQESMCMDICIPIKKKS